MTKEVFHIEDLGEPRFDPDTQEMLDLGAAMARDLDSVSYTHLTLPTNREV